MPNPHSASTVVNLRGLVLALVVGRIWLSTSGVAGEFVSLFNGTNLAGWQMKCQPADQDKVFWKADGGSILCDSINHPNHGYVWLITEKEFGDFELRLEFQAYRESPGNSGLQFRSRFDDSSSGGWLDGPQVDIHPPAAMSWRTGLIYDETREERRWICPSLKNSTMDPKFKPERHVFKYAEDGDGWNQLTLVCHGTRVKTVLNGVVVTDWDGAGVLNNAAHLKHQVGLTGHFALQLHTGDQLRIRFRNILVRENSPPVGKEARPFRDCLLPAAKNGGFQMDGYTLWCPSVIQVDGTYHLFASRWPAEHGMAGWTRFSEVVRATSTKLTGPYVFQEVVLQKRTNNWDNTRVHNPKIVKVGSKFVLYYIDTANETGFADAEAITGPWKRRDQVAMRLSNPAILVRPDRSIYVFGRLGDAARFNRGIAFTAPTYEGPYSLVGSGETLLPDGSELEDPTIWWANGQYNLLVNDWKGKASGVSKAGAQYFSRDGVHYTLMGREPVFTKSVVYDDGSSETFARRERPFVYVNEKAEVIALFTACLPSTGPARVVVQPVDHYVPGN